MAPRAGRTRAGWHDCTVALALLPCALGVLHPAAVAVGPDGGLAHMRRALDHETAVVEALVQAKELAASGDSKALEHLQEAARMRGDVEQNEIIEDIKARQATSTQDVETMRISLTTETMPASQEMSNKLNNQMVVEIKKFIEMIETFSKSTYMHTKNQLVTWKNEDTMDTVKDKKEIKKNSDSLKSAQETFERAQGDLDGRADGFKKDWRRYVDNQYGEDGKYTEAINKAQKLIAKETAARIEDFKRKKDQLEDRISFGAETQTRALSKMEDKSKSSVDKTSKKVDEYLEFGKVLLKDHTSFGKTIVTGSKFITKDDHALDGEIIKKQMDLKSNHEKHTAESSEMLEDAVDQGAEEIGKVSGYWMRNKARAIKNARTDLAGVDRTFKKDLKKNENGIGSESKAVLKALRTQTKVSSRAESEVAREAGYFDMETDELIAAARASVKDHEQKKKQLEDMKAALLADSTAKGQEAMTLTGDEAAGAYNSLGHSIEDLEVSGADQIHDQDSKNNDGFNRVAADINAGEATQTEQGERLAAGVVATDQLAAGEAGNLQTAEQQLSAGFSDLSHTDALYNQHSQDVNYASSQTADGEFKAEEDTTNGAFSSTGSDIDSDEAASNAEASDRTGTVTAETKAGLEEVGAEKTAASNEMQAQIANETQALKAIAGQEQQTDAELKTRLQESAKTDRLISGDAAATRAGLALTDRDMRAEMSRGISGFSAAQSNAISESKQSGLNTVAAGQSQAQSLVSALGAETTAAARGFSAGSEETGAALDHVAQEADETDGALTSTEADASRDMADSEHQVQTAGLDIKNEQAKSTAAVTAIGDEARQKLLDVINAGNGGYGAMLSKSEQADADDAQRLEAQRIMMEAALNKELGTVKATQKTNVNRLVLGTQKLDNWAIQTGEDEKNSVAAFMQQFDIINAAIADVLRQNGDDADAQARALDAHMMMIDKALEHSMSKVDADVAARMRMKAADLNNNMRTVVASAKTMNAEQFDALQDLQTSSKGEIMSVMSHADQLAPSLAKYKRDQEQARTDEEAWIAGAADDADHMGGERKTEQDRMMKEAKEAAGDVLTSVMGALEAADAMEGDVHAALGKIAEQNGAEVDQLERDSTSVFLDVDAQLADAKRESKMAEKSSDRDREWAKNLVGRTSSVMKSMESTVGAELEKLKLGLESERNRAYASATSLSEERKRLMQDLHEVLGEAKDVATDVFTKRMSALDALDAALTGQVDDLAAAGHTALADALRSSVSFAQQYLSNLAHVKISMYEDMQLEAAADRDSTLASDRYRELRKQLVAQSEASVEQNAAFEDELAEKLRQLGASGNVATARLADRLHELTFSLAEGERAGFAQLLGGLSGQFAQSAHAEHKLSDMLGASLLDLARKQGSLAQIVLAVSKSVDGVEGKTKAFEAQLNRDLDRIRDVEHISEEQLHRKIGEVKRVMGRLAEHSSMLQRTGAQKADAAAWQNRLALLEERALRDRDHRKAAIKEQARMKALLGTLRELRARGRQPTVAS